MPRNHPAAPSHELVDKYFRANRDLRPSTKSTTRSSLNRWVAYMEDQAKDIRTATTEDVDAWLDSLETNGLSDTTINSNRDRLNWFYAWAVEAGVLVKPQRNIRAKGKGQPATNPVTASHKRKPMAITPPHIMDGEYAKLLKACASDAMGRRDAAILSLLRYQGLRRAEICGLDIKAYRFTDHEAELRVGTARHRTKGNKDRDVPLCADTIEKMDAYLTVRSDGDGALFVSASSADGRLTPGAINQIIDKLRLKAKIARRIGVHEFRRAWAIDMKRRGVSDRAMMTVAGWEDPTMVHRYTRAAEVEIAHAEIRKAYGQMDKANMKPRLRRAS